jgi:phosphocarrier protein HPr
LITELRETVKIVNIKGLHARASAKFVNMVAMLPDGLDVKVIKDGMEAGGGSILGLMMLGAAKGEFIDITVAANAATADEAEQALAKLVGLIVDGFGED